MTIIKMLADAGDLRAGTIHEDLPAERVAELLTEGLAIRWHKPKRDAAPVEAETAKPRRRRHR